MYYEYWGLKKPPFDNVPDPSMYVDSHASMENAIAETLFAIEEGGESIAVIVGDVGLGKTLSLRMIIDSLEQEKYKIALITNPSITFFQMVKEIIGQLTGKPYDATRKVDLLETFNKLLFETVDEGKKVLIFIDEANAISPANLENLRLLTNMQEDHENLFTMVLAGQNELARRLEDPRRANLFQRIGTYNKIDKIQSEELLKIYVEARLKLAGRTETIFVDDVFNPLWEYSEHGVPRLINKICKLCLKAGETNELNSVTGEMVDQIGQRFQRLTGSATQKRRPRKIFEKEETQEKVQGTKRTAERVLADHEEHIPEPFVETPDSMVSPGLVEKPTVETPDSMVSPLPGPAEEPPPVGGGGMGEKGESQPALKEAEADKFPQRSREAAVAEDKKSVQIEIGTMKAMITLPLQVIQQAQSSTKEQHVKLAGVLAARFLQQHPQFTSSHLSDPVDIWSKIRRSVLDMFEEERKVDVT